MLMINDNDIQVGSGEAMFAEDEEEIVEGAEPNAEDWEDLEEWEIDNNTQSYRYTVFQ